MTSLPAAFFFSKGGAAENGYSARQRLPDRIAQIILELHLVGFPGQPRPDERGVLSGAGGELDVKCRNLTAGVETERKQIAGAVPVVGSHQIGGGALEDQRLPVATEEREERAVVRRAIAKLASAQQSRRAAGPVVNEHIRYAVAVAQHQIVSGTSIGDEPAVRTDNRRTGRSIARPGAGKITTDEKIGLGQDIVKVHIEKDAAIRRGQNHACLKREHISIGTEIPAPAIIVAKIASVSQTNSRRRSRARKK